MSRGTGLLRVASQGITSGSPGLSPPQRLPLGIPIKIAIIEKIESARGTSCPARSLFLSPQPPHNPKRPLRRREVSKNALLSACYDTFILNANQVIFLGFVLEKRFARRPTNSRIRKISLDLFMQNQLFVNLHTPHVQFMKMKR